MERINGGKWLMGCLMKSIEKRLQRKRGAGIEKLLFQIGRQGNREGKYIRRYQKEREKGYGNDCLRNTC